jgi:hypothetical protein
MITYCKSCGYPNPARLDSCFKCGLILRPAIVSLPAKLKILNQATLVMSKEALAQVLEQIDFDSCSVESLQEAISKADCSQQDVK